MQIQLTLSDCQIAVHDLIPRCRGTFSTIRGQPASQVVKQHRSIAINAPTRNVLISTCQLGSCEFHLGLNSVSGTSSTATHWRKAIHVGTGRRPVDIKSPSVGDRLIHQTEMHPTDAEIHRTVKPGKIGTHHLDLNNAIGGRLGSNVPGRPVRPADVLPNTHHINTLIRINFVR